MSSCTARFCKVLQLATPFTTAAVFLVSRAIEIITIKTSPQLPASQSIRQTILYLYCIPSATLCIESAIRIFGNAFGDIGVAALSKDVSLIGLLLGGLVWLTLLLLLVTTKHLPWRSCGSSAFVSAVLQVGLMASSHSVSTDGTRPAVFTFQCLRFAASVAISAVCALFAIRMRDLESRAETEPLLGQAGVSDPCRSASLHSSSQISDDDDDDDDSDSNKDYFFSEKQKKVLLFGKAEESRARPRGSIQLSMAV